MNNTTRSELSEIFGRMMAELIVLQGANLNSANEVWASWLHTICSVEAITMERRDELIAMGPRRSYLLDSLCLLTA